VSGGPSHWAACRCALRLLTVLPLPAASAPSNSEQGLSLLWYPAVGLLIGLLLYFAAGLFPVPFYVQAVVVVGFWILVTGALHLDGLADCADAWLGGMGDRDTTLRLLKDPLAGSMAVVALVFAVIAKCVLVASLLQDGLAPWLILPPLVARASLLGLFSTTPYVREEGLGELLASHFPRAWANRLLGLTVVGMFLVMGLWVAIAVLVGAAIVFVVLRQLALRRLGGFTGDVAGAQVELLELAVLFALVLILSGD